MSLSYMFHSVQDNNKFVIRLNQRYFKIEQKAMVSNDEWVTIQYQYDRIRPYKNRDAELYEYL